MCNACYVKYGSPKKMPKEYDEADELYKRIYEKSSVGGNLHIILDDWNLENEHIKYCLHLQESDTNEKRLCEILLSWTLEERATWLNTVDY